MYLIDKIVFHTDEKYLKLGKQKISLDKQTSDILFLLIETKKPVSKETLVEKIWQGRHVSDAAITSAIRRVRKSIAELDRSKEYIKTLSKIGYQINVSVSNSSISTSAVASSRPIFFKVKYLIICVLILATVLSWNRVNNVPQQLPASYRQAVHLLAQKDEKKLPQAIVLLEQSIKKVPDFVPAYHALSRLYANKMSRHLGLSDQQIVNKATTYIEHAAELAPENPDTLLSQAMLDFFYLRDLGAVTNYHQQVARGMACDDKCYFFLSYSAPLFDQTDIAIEYAEKAYQAQPDHATYVWARAWSQFMAGNFELTLERINQAENFVGRTSYLFRAMLAQAQQEPEEAITYWLSFYQSIDKLPEIKADELKELVTSQGSQQVAGLLLEQLDDIAIDQKVELLLLAGKKQQAIEQILATNSLQAQTYLVAMHVSPVFTVAFTIEELRVLRQHIWKSSADYFHYDAQ